MKTLINNSRFCPSHPGHERGSALILAMFVSIIAVGITLSGSYMVKAHASKTEAMFFMSGQAGQFARSGLTEVLNWFRLQPNQPVQVFTPVFDDLADPQILETDEPDIGRRLDPAAAIARALLLRGAGRRRCAPRRDRAGAAVARS